MARIDFTRDKLRKQRNSAAQSQTTCELFGNLSAQNQAIIKGMGNNRKAEPLRRIDPTSPEGRALARRYLT